MNWIGIYAEPIGSAAYYFLGLCLVLAIPYFAWQYRRWGAVDPGRVWAQTSFMLYLMCAWALVLMPFPEDPCARDVNPQLELFNWLDLARAGSSDRLSLLTHPNFVMFAFNVALLAPFGVYLRRWFGRGILTTTLLGFAMSLAFETTQFTANFGFYACTYRQFNVDDLIANTAGAAAGWLIAPLVFIVPRRGQAPSAKDSVSVPRRGLSTVIDYLLAMLLGVAWVTVRETLGVPSQDVLDPLVIVLLVTAWLVPVVTGGRTPGQFAVGIRMRSTRGSWRNPWRLLVRWALVWGPYPAVLALVDWGSANVGDFPGQAALVGAALLTLWPLVLTTRIHERVSRTRTLVDRSRSGPVGLDEGR